MTKEVYVSPIEKFALLLDSWDYGVSSVEMKSSGGFIDIEIDLYLNMSIKVHTNCQKDFDIIWSAIQRLTNKHGHANK
jgi:hypothetical protein